MKKTWMLIVLAFVCVFITGCNKPAEQSKSCEEDPNQEKCQEEVKYDFQGKEFKIMVNSQLSDPFSDTYEGLYQREKQENQRRVEEKYNIKVKYVTYKPNPSWGVPRDNYIINSEIAGQAPAHVYSIPTSAIPALAAAGAIAPVGQYYDKYADDQFLKYKKSFVKFEDDYYGYDDSYPYTNCGLYYNQDILNELGYDPDYPTKKWHDGEWTWDTFQSFVKELNTKLNEDEYPMGGILYDWAYGMVPANGGYFLNDSLESGLNSPETIEALDNLAGLYAIPGMWINNADFAYSTEPSFTKGKVVFNPGESWHVYDPSRMGAKERNFDIGFVPFPKGNHVVNGDSEYKTLVSMWGPATYVYSGSYQDVPEGYENVMFSTETIYMIHSELLYFGDVEDTLIDLSINFLKYYANQDSVDAHLQVIDKAYNDLFYGLGEDSFGWEDNNFNVQINNAISSNSVRAKMTILEGNMKKAIESMFE